jgi:predicted nucleic acid-binding protein
MPIVLDSSMAMALWMDDEEVADAEGILAVLVTERVVVPPIWIFEVANSLAMAARRGRIANEECQPRLALMLGLPLEVEGHNADRVSMKTLGLALAHSLTVYDASYVEMAVRRGERLATLDDRMAAAARAEGVEVIGG